MRKRHVRRTSNTVSFHSVTLPKDTRFSPFHYAVFQIDQLPMRTWRGNDILHCAGGETRFRILIRLLKDQTKTWTSFGGYI